MNGRAHTALGVGTALATCNALGLIDGTIEVDKIIVVGAFSAVAATLPDIDVGAAKKVYRTSIFALIGIAGLVLATMLLKVSLKSVMMSTAYGLIGAGLFAALSVIGQKQPHRGMTHSIVACALFTVSVCMVLYWIDKHFVVLGTVAFGVAYMSHLLIDLLNRKGEQLFWPLPNRFCFKVCSASGFGNECTFVGGILLIVISLAKVVL